MSLGRSNAWAADQLLRAGPWLLVIMVALLMAIGVLVDIPAADDVGSWRWHAARFG